MIQKFLADYAAYNLAFDYGLTLDSGTTWKKVTAPAEGMKPGYSVDFQATDAASFAFRFLVVSNTATTDIRNSITEFMKNNCTFSIVQLD